MTLSVVCFDMMAMRPARSRTGSSERTSKYPRMQIFKALALAVICAKLFTNICICLWRENHDSIFGHIFGTTYPIIFKFELELLVEIPVILTIYLLF